MGPVRYAVGLALTAALSACSLPATPLPGGSGERQPNPPPSASPPWPPPVESAAGCDLYLQGVVVEGVSDRTQRVADAVVNWRHADGGTFHPTDEIRTDSSGRYNVCVPTPPALCDSGACRVKYEIRAEKIGYATASTSVVVDYNYWWLNFFKAPDLQLVRE